MQIAKALSKEFSSVGYRVFDVTMKQKPSDSRKGPIEGWGGYDVAFKLIEEDKALKIGDDIGAMQRQAIPVNPNVDGRIICNRTRLII